jgi:LmbE family N-acetylglucosaminyl deacetylase
MPVEQVDYCYTIVKAGRAGEAAHALSALRKAGVNLLAFTGFPTRGGKAQLDFVTDDLLGLRRVAKQQGWKLSTPKKAFLVHGSDAVGACHAQLKKLAKRGINVTAADAVTAGKGRYGMILWVKQKDQARAARALGVR